MDRATAVRNTNANFCRRPTAVVHDRLLSGISTSLRFHMPTRSLPLYRVERDGSLRKPYALKSRSKPDLVEYVQRHLGAGDYKFIIRRGRTMVFSGEIAMAAPIAKARKTGRERMKKMGQLNGTNRHTIIRPLSPHRANDRRPGCQAQPPRALALPPCNAPSRTGSGYGKRSRAAD